MEGGGTVNQCLDSASCFAAVLVTEIVLIVLLLVVAHVWIEGKHRE